MTDNDRGKPEGFLARWSERKRAVRESEAAADAKAAAGAPGAAEQTDDAEILAANRAAAEAIDLESLTAQSDISPFLKRGVPTALKTAALGKLWRSDPVFACLDGLDIYREDYNSPAYLLKAGKSSWLPGSGYTQRLTELEAKAKEALAEGEIGENPSRAEDGPVAETASGPPAGEHPGADPAETVEPTEVAEIPAEHGPGAEADTAEAEPEPRVPLRSRLDFAAFKDEG